MIAPKRTGRLLALLAAVATALTAWFAPSAATAATVQPTPTPTPTAVNPTAPDLEPGIYVLRGSSINLVSRESKVPVAIRNTFDSDVRVQVHINPSNPRVIVPSAVEITVPGGETVNAQVPVKAVAQGKVFLIVWVTTFSGIRLTKDRYIEMTVNPDVEVTLLSAFGALVVGLGAVGAWRMIRRRKAEETA
jgi:hypothetical protein